MKLLKVMNGDSEDRNSLFRIILSSPEGVLPLPESILTWTHNFASMPEVTFSDICNFLLGKSDGHDEYSEGNLKSFKSLLGYRLFRDGHALDQQLHKGRLPSKMQKFLSLSMARSTWMRTLAMLAVLALAFFDSCFP